MIQFADANAFTAPRGYRPALEVAPDKRTFVLDLRPRRFPFFPYNLLVSQPTYRVDETGRIRAERVHSEKTCSPDAPVVGEVASGEISAAKAQREARTGAAQ
ncbi:MAG: hypothetical protein QM765_21410 [Myxococcales bacterium]